MKAAVNLNKDCKDSEKYSLISRSGGTAPSRHQLRNMPEAKKRNIQKSGKRRVRSGAKRRRPQEKRKPRNVAVGLWTAAGIVLVVVLLLCIQLIRRAGTDGYETGAKVPDGEWRYGIDISHHNADGIAWDSLYVMTDRKGRTIRDVQAARDIAPVSFVFIKATEGVSLVDRDFRKNWKAAGRSGLRRGAYHFFRSSKDGKAQAELFIKTVGDLRFKDLPPVLDIETIHRGGSRKRLNEEALEWLETIERHYGKKPIVYAGSSFAKDYLSPGITDNYPIWIAHYEKARPSFEGWTWWQFTDRAVVKGVPGLVDLSVMRK